jgi:hypothetical protein
VKDNTLERALRFPNLRKLIFHKFSPPLNVFDAARKFQQGRRLEDDFECEFLNTFSTPPSVRSLDCIGEFTTTEVLRFMLLPNLAAFAAKELPRITHPHLPAPFQGMTKNLISLDISGRSTWEIHHFDASDVNFQCKQCRMTQSSRVEIPVSPEEVRDALEPVRETLEELCVLPMRYHALGDGSHMDLTGFHALRYLQICS